MTYSHGCEVCVIGVWVCGAKITDVVINETHSEVERNEMCIPGVSNSLLGINLKLPAQS